MLTLEQIMKDSMWVAKVGGCRYVGTYDEIKRWYDDEDWRDTDLAAEQPEHLREFYDAYFKYDGFITVQDFYEAYYAKTVHSHVWTADEIKNLIQTNDEVLYRALKKLYECQTADEQVCKQTRAKNGQGFNSVDSEFLSSVSEFLIRRGYLSDKQKFYVRKKLAKYTKQLTRLANS